MVVKIVAGVFVWTERLDGKTDATKGGDATAGHCPDRHWRFTEYVPVSRPSRAVTSSV